MTYIFNITPIGKPRMTRRDQWWQTSKTARKCVIDYYAFKDELNLKAKVKGYHIDDILSITFYLPMPPSWSKKKRAEMNGRPHQQKPDFDNLLKAFTDALCKDDSTIWSCKMQKYWSEGPQIVVEDAV